MSSHHFVKEQQEPALLVLDTSGISFEQIAPLLEWVPTILVAKDEVPVVISWGVKIDLILAEMKFQKSHYHLLEEQYPVQQFCVFQGIQALYQDAPMFPKGIGGKNTSKQSFAYHLPRWNTQATSQPQLFPATCR